MMMIKFTALLAIFVLSGCGDPDYQPQEIQQKLRPVQGSYSTNDIPYK